MAAHFADQAAWLCPLLSALMFLLLFALWSAVFRNGEITGPAVFFERALGKVMGRVMLVLFLLWIIVLYFLYIRYYAERLVETIFTGTSIHLFTAVMLLLVFMAARGKLESFARFCEISILIFTLVFAVFFLFLAPSIKLENVWPVTHLDALPVLKGTYPVLGIWGYLSFVLFLGDRISGKEQMERHRKAATLYLTAVSVLVIFTVVGTLGPALADRMPIPFFSAVKAISFLETLDRVESMLLSIWVISDFIVVTLFALLIIAIVRDLFRIAQTRYLSTPVALLGYGGSQFLASSRFELEKFSSGLGLSVNIIMTFAVPILIFLIGKIRGKLPAQPAPASRENLSSQVNSPNQAAPSAQAGSPGKAPPSAQENPPAKAGSPNQAAPSARKNPSSKEDSQDNAPN